MIDRWGIPADTVSSPATNAVSVLPNDTADLADLPKGIYVGVGGDLTVLGRDTPDGAAAIVFRNVPSGALIPFRARRVFATGTTASAMLALF